MGLRDEIAIVARAAQGIGRSIMGRFTKRRLRIASVAVPAAAAYHASKAGVRNLTKKAAVTYAWQNASSTRLRMDGVDKDAAASGRQEGVPPRRNVIYPKNAATMVALSAPTLEYEYC